MAVLKTFPLETVVELHVAGGQLDPEHTWRYADTHLHPILPEQFDLLAAAVASCSNVGAVTYEISPGLPFSTFERDFEQLEQVLTRAAFSPRVQREHWPKGARGAA